MHNLPQIPWKQTSHSSTSGGMWLVKKFLLLTIGECVNILTGFEFPPYIHHIDRDIESRVMTTTQNQFRFHKPENDLYSVQPYKCPFFRNGMTIFLKSICHKSLRLSLTEFVLSFTSQMSLTLCMYCISEIPFATSPLQSSTQTIAILLASQTIFCSELSWFQCILSF